MTTEPTTTVDLEALVGIGEIADRLGVATDTVNHWRWRAARSEPATYRAAGGEERHALPMPEPAATISGTPIWIWADIAAWAVRTGRKVVTPTE